MRTIDGLSVVVPAFNEEKYLPATLGALNVARERLHASHSITSEIVVVNNLSTDRTREVAESCGARVIDHEVRNISSVRNAGLRATKYNLIFTIDSDCLLEPEGLVRVFEAMRDERTVGGSCNLVVAAKDWVAKAATFVVQRSVLLIAGINGSLFFFMKEDALSLGGFPEDRLIAEDSVFAMKLKTLGETRGQRFRLLRNVQVTTTDRKNTRLRDLIPLIPAVIRQFNGRKVDIKDLGYWYDPKR